jgi:hypothetical protein
MIVALLAAVGAEAERVPSPSEVIDATIRYHDPNGRWFASHNTLVLKQTRPGGHSEKAVSFTLYPSPDRFRLTFGQDGHVVTGEFNGSSCVTEPETLSEEEKELFRRFDCEGLPFWLDYYGYLFSAPMNLRDEGAEVAPVVVKEALEGRDAYRVTVGYGEGQPVWEYFVDVSTFELLGCRFSSGGERKDGELIVYEGEVESNGVRLPKKRSWYLHADGSLIGVDTIEQYIREESM